MATWTSSESEVLATTPATARATTPTTARATAAATSTVVPKDALIKNTAISSSSASDVLANTPATARATATATSTVVPKDSLITELIGAFPGLQEIAEYAAMMEKLGDSNAKLEQLMAELKITSDSVSAGCNNTSGGNISTLSNLVEKIRNLMDQISAISEERPKPEDLRDLVGKLLKKELVWLTSKAEAAALVNIVSGLREGGVNWKPIIKVVVNKRNDGQKIQIQKMLNSVGLIMSFT